MCSPQRIVQPTAQRNCWARAGLPAPRRRHLLQAPRGRGVHARASPARSAPARCHALARASRSCPHHPQRSGPGAGRAQGIFGQWTDAVALLHGTLRVTPGHDVREEDRHTGTRYIKRNSAAAHLMRANLRARIRLPALRWAGRCALAGLHELQDSAEHWAVAAVCSQ